MSEERQQRADAYEQLLRRVHADCCCGEDTAETELPGELAVQALWQAGLLGHEGETLRHGKVKILDFGEWNRSSGPDFLRAEIEIGGARMRGDIEIDPTEQDWERHGHGANPDYTQVILHVVLRRPPSGWYTRNAQHIDIPILPIEQDVIRTATGKSLPLTPATTPLCREPLSTMNSADIDDMLRSAAAFRARNKKRIFTRKAEALGNDQAWFEAVAETLGYKINKLAMQMLARRAPLKSLTHEPESLLFGTAGFLVPVLPHSCDRATRDYHRRVWDGWWPSRESFALSEERALPWKYAPLRPANHPHRRVAALALIASRWKEISRLLSAEHATELIRQLTTLRHPYWNIHSSLPSPELNRSVALIGAERAQDFLVNHVYVQDDSPLAWQSFLHLRQKDIPQRVLTTARQLFGERPELKSLLHYTYVQQALLQIDADFCVQNSCRDCLFPEQLCQWKNHSN